MTGRPVSRRFGPQLVVQKKGSLVREVRVEYAHVLFDRANQASVDVLQSMGCELAVIEDDNEFAVAVVVVSRVAALIVMRRLLRRRSWCHEAMLLEEDDGGWLLFFPQVRGRVVVH